MTRTSRILAIVSVCVSFCPAAWSDQNVSLAWDASPDSATTGYILHYGTKSRMYTSQINAGTNRVITLSGLKSGNTYYFAAAAFNSAGIEGVPSNEASFAVPTNTPGPPPAEPSSAIVSPASAPVGSQVYIYGTNLSTASSVQFNGVSGSFMIVSDTIVTATVPAGAGSGPLTITTDLGTVSGQFTVIATASPANDAFANARILTGPEAFASETTVGATKQSGEPNHAGNTGGGSVWYRWTAPASGVYTLDAGGSDFRTLLAVYTGNSVNSLSPVASSAAGAGLTNTVTFTATAGITYQVAADGFGGAHGNLVLRLAPLFSTTTIFSDNFEPTEGLQSSSKLAGQNGWVSPVAKLTGLISGYFANYGQQAYLGFSAITLTTNTVLLYHPLNFTVDTSTRPLIEFSVLMESYSVLLQTHASFGWSVRNADGHELFGISFDNATGLVSYNLDNGAGPITTGMTFSSGLMYALVIDMDFARNRWSASANGISVVTEQPITTVHAPLTLGDIAARAIYPALQIGGDGMLFDNYLVTAGPARTPQILLGPQSQTAAVGSDVTLGVIAAGEPPPSYQWYFDGGMVPGATGASLTVKNVTANQTGNYFVQIANANGSATATATVTVATTAAASMLAAPPAMTAQGAVLNVSLVPGHSYRVQASTNLHNWYLVGSFYANGSNAVCLDPVAMTSPRRYYRVASP